MTPGVVFALGYAFAAAVQPGPFQAYVVSQALSRGWRRALPVAFAPLLSDIPVIAVVLLVLSRVSERMIQGLQIGGGLLLLYLALGAYRSWRRGPDDAPAPTGSDGMTLLKAVSVNFLGPGPWLGWSLVMGPLLVEAWRRDPAEGAAIVAAFYATMVLTLMAIIALFAGARRLGPRVRRASVGVSALALALFGLYSLWQGSGML